MERTNPTTGGNVASFLSKYDLNGNRKWTRIFGKSGVGNTFPQGIAIDSTGNIFVSGSASSGNINGLTITASTAGFIIKYDTNGNQLWINSSAPSITHEGTGIALDSSGNPNLSTIVRATSLHQTNLGGSEAGLSIVKYNGSTGAYMTSVMVSTASGGTFRALQAYGGIVSDSSGNLYVGVATRSSVYCGSGTAIYNPALFRFDSNLNYLNCTGLTSPSLDSFPFSLAVDSSGVYMSAMQ
ncbi:MAG: SBBP repeat-containing protein [Leptospiraceae bacterium]|nr:SBBP repeat-containing protein [Leptospiraceae bacterium]